MTLSGLSGLSAPFSVTGKTPVRPHRACGELHDQRDDGDHRQGILVDDRHDGGRRTETPALPVSWVPSASPARTRFRGAAARSRTASGQFAFTNTTFTFTISGANRRSSP